MTFFRKTLLRKKKNVRPYSLPQREGDADRYGNHAALRVWRTFRDDSDWKTARISSCHGACELRAPSRRKTLSVTRRPATFLGLDPHMHNHGTTNALKGMVYGALVHRKYDLSLEPDLAESWSNIDDVTWEFKLREGVTFHDGTPFTADDVLYSFRRVTQENAEMSGFLSSVETMEKIDDYTIHIITKGPDPILLQNLSQFFIVSEEFKEANDGFPVVLGAGSTNFANLNANGTGPYRVVEWLQDNRLVLEINPDFWGYDELETNVERAVMMPIGNDATRVAAILSGEIDMMYPVPLQDIPRLEQDSNIEVLQGPELRTIFLGFDQHRDELMDMPGSGENPFLDVRVRQAFAHALDLTAIQRVVMRGASQPHRFDDCTWH